MTLKEVVILNTMDIREKMSVERNMRSPREIRMLRA